MSDLHTVVDEIMERSRQRTDLHRSEKALTLRIKAIFRRAHQGDKDAANDAYDATDKWLRKQFKVNTHKDDVVFLAEQEIKEHPARVALTNALPLFYARNIIEPERKALEVRMEKLAKTLPVWSWIEGVRGVSALSLANVIGESGAPDRFDRVQKLWKRMGLGIVGNERQRKCADAEKALLHGYSPVRRSIVWNVGDCLIKSQKDGMRYRDIYVSEKARQKDLHPELTDMHAHNRAKRKMEKAFLRDLWNVWRRSTSAETAMSEEPKTVATPADALPIATGAVVAPSAREPVGTPSAALTSSGRKAPARSGSKVSSAHTLTDASASMDQAADSVPAAQPIAARKKRQGRSGSAGAPAGLDASASINGMAPPPSVAPRRDGVRAPKSVGNGLAHDINGSNPLKAGGQHLSAAPMAKGSDDA
jgi:hypothetical protein